MVGETGKVVLADINESMLKMGRVEAGGDRCDWQR
ncbi:hypothetical protein ACNKHX_23855 [Shigella flexneri]